METLIEDVLKSTFSLWQISVNEARSTALNAEAAVLASKGENALIAQLTALGAATQRYESKWTALSGKLANKGVDLDLFLKEHNDVIIRLN